MGRQTAPYSKQKRYLCPAAIMTAHALHCQQRSSLHRRCCLVLGSTDREPGGKKHQDREERGKEGKKGGRREGGKLHLQHISAWKYSPEWFYLLPDRSRLDSGCSVLSSVAWIWGPDGHWCRAGWRCRAEGMLRWSSSWWFLVCWKVAVSTVFENTLFFYLGALTPQEV